MTIRELISELEHCGLDHPIYVYNGKDYVEVSNVEDYTGDGDYVIE